LKSSLSQRGARKEVSKGSNAFGFSLPLGGIDYYYGGAALARDGLRPLRHGTVNHLAEFCFGLGYGPGLRAHFGRASPSSDDYHGHYSHKLWPAQLIARFRSGQALEAAVAT
jgi:hypothetical protein